MRTLYNKFDKKSLANLPIVAFDKKIVVVNNTFDAEKAVDFLLKQDMLGFDTETRPSFQRGNVNQVPPSINRQVQTFSAAIVALLLRTLS